MSKHENPNQQEYYISINNSVRLIKNEQTLELIDAFLKKLIRKRGDS